MTFWSNLALAKINSRKPPKPRFKLELTPSCLQTHWNISLATLRWAVNKRKEELGRPSATGICTHEFSEEHKNLWSLPDSSPSSEHQEEDYQAGFINGQTMKAKSTTNLNNCTEFLTPLIKHRQTGTSTIREIVKGFPGKVGLLQQSALYSGMEQTLAFHIPAFTHIQRDIFNFAK